MSPQLLLLIGLAVLAFLVWLFWPHKGGLIQLRKLLRNNERVLVEDALKFIFDCEYNKIICTINGIAGHLQLTVDQAGKLLNRLTSLELITLDHKYVTLTDAGRSYALRVVRIHRVLEHYLADQTGLSPEDWHAEACRIEHLVTESETENLAKKIGNPLFDPHGDPIPTADGFIPQQKGQPLNTLKKGEIGRIIHLEDEPKSIYEQLLVLGLYPGMEVHVTESTDKKIAFIANGDEISLTPLFSGYITIEKVKEKQEIQTKHEVLSSLKVGEEAEVIGISPLCRGQQRRRLLDLGIIPGSKIEAVMKSASGDPVGYHVMGTTIGIRRQHADLVYINRINLN